MRRALRPLAATSVALSAFVALGLGVGAFVGIPGGHAKGEGAGPIWARGHVASHGGYRLFDAGDRVEGWPLTAVVRRDDTATFVSFVYGDCRATDDLGCAPPVEIQVWPSCRRSLAFYEPRPGVPIPERTHVRGVPAAFFDQGTRLELQTGGSTIVLFGDSRERLLRVAGGLRSLDGLVGPGEPLAAPEASSARARGGGAMDC